MYIDDDLICYKPICHYVTVALSQDDIFWLTQRPPNAVNTVGVEQCGTALRRLNGAALLCLSSEREHARKQDHC